MSPSQKLWVWNWILPAKHRVMCNGSGKKELDIHPAVDFRIIWGARTENLLPQVDHKSPIFDRMQVKRETVECVDLQTRAFLFHSQVWTEREIRRETRQVFYGNRKKDPCTMISGLLEQQAGPSHQEAQTMSIYCRMAFFPPPSSSTSRYSLATEVFLSLRHVMHEFLRQGEASLTRVSC